MQDGDEMGFAIILMFICAIGIALVVGFIGAVQESPWILIFVGLAGVVWWLKKRADKRWR
jgi:hypothetical protein